jgi:hypothetical protein
MKRYAMIPIVQVLMLLLAAACGNRSAIGGAPKYTPSTTEGTPAIATASAATTESQPLTIAMPPSGQYYHGVFPGREDGEEDLIRPSDLVAYEQAVGKTAAWVYFSDNWFRGRAFPLENATWIRDTGSVPYIRLMLRSDVTQNVAEPVFNLQAIIDGEFDDDLQAWCEGARDFGTPLIVEYGTEVNGEWFSWNGVYNGGGTTDGYGDPTFPDGPERFRDAYRHIITICREAGAENITWVFHVNDGDWPREEWNAFENYYPGDEYIDWLGLSVYGAQTPTSEWWDDFTTAMDEFYPRLDALTPSKPIIIAEFGSTDNSPSVAPGDWAQAALTGILSGRWPRLIGFSWWNESWQNDAFPAHDTVMRVQDVPALAAVFQELVGEDPNVLGRLIFK